MGACKDCDELKQRMLTVFAEKVDDGHILFSEPARAAAERFANYWSGMGPGELDETRVRTDLAEMYVYLNNWVTQLFRELPDDMGDPIQGGLADGIRSDQAA